MRKLITGVLLGLVIVLIAGFMYVTPVHAKSNTPPIPLPPHNITQQEKAPVAAKTGWTLTNTMIDPKNGVCRLSYLNKDKSSVDFNWMEVEGHPTSLLIAHSPSIPKDVDEVPVNLMIGFLQQDGQFGMMTLPGNLLQSGFWTDGFASTDFFHHFMTDMVVSVQVGTAVVLSPLSELDPATRKSFAICLMELHTRQDSPPKEDDLIVQYAY